MIHLTKLDQSRILIGLETIKYIEGTPDTLIRFVNGESLMVRESIDDICILVENMKRRLTSSENQGR